MLLPDEVALDFAIARAGLILIVSLALLVYLVRLAVKVTSRQLQSGRVPGAARLRTLKSQDTGLLQSGRLRGEGDAIVRTASLGICFVAQAFSRI